MKQLCFTTSQEWREWLHKNHDQETEVWLVFYKKKTGKPCISYDAAVEEALCFGWIDSIVRKIDEEKYAQKFTPRKDKSKWSESNKNRIAKLIQEERMTEIGLMKIQAAKANGQWEKPDRPEINYDLPEELQSAFQENTKAKENFEHLALSYQKQFIAWIKTAKREETKKKRIQESISLLERGEKLGMK